jgi:hypothetical protein
MPHDLGAWVFLLFAALFALAILFPRPPRPGVAVTLGLAVHVDGMTFFGVTTMTMKQNQKVALVLNPKDAEGLPASVNTIAWSASAAGLTVADDKLSAVFVPQASGTVVFTVTAKASDGSDLSDSVSEDVVEGVAVTLGLTLGTPEPV